MIVDDAANMRSILHFNLKKKGYNVIGVDSGKAALDVLGETIPDLIVLDIMMPKMDGYEVIRRLKETNTTKNIPVIFLTAKAQKKDVIKGMTAGGDDYVVKPYQFEALHDKIKDLLDIRGKQLQLENPDRELAAIMATDIAGFSSEMENNEAHTYSKLLIHNEIIRKNIVKNKGSEIKTIGDAFMVQFKSAVNAVKAGISMQKEFLEYNKDKTKGDQISVRIGIHMGDIFIVDNDVFGNGVNIASRIESIAEPGGICISSDVYNVVKKLIDISVSGLGKEVLKNIKDPPELYKILLESDN